MTNNRLTGQESTADLLDIRRQSIKERRIKKAFALKLSLISSDQRENKTIRQMYMPPEYPSIA
ncbi:MAG: hypothetical protein IJH32_04975 [Ruminococcus sp.]|nr:hypothetical protein [Ruminococcus sp.]